MGHNENESNDSGTGSGQEKEYNSHSSVDDKRDVFRMRLGSYNYNDPQMDHEEEEEDMYDDEGARRLKALKAEKMNANLSVCDTSCGIGREKCILF